MKLLSHWVRSLPILVFAVFGGTALILCNPGYFWDDWVWIFQSPTDAIRIGRELGIWWGGYATNFINALPHPSLYMRGVALVGWLIAGAAFVRVLYRERLISGGEAFQLFLIYSSTQVALIRFLTSVTFYNLYIASFWLGCSVLLSKPNSKIRFALSLPLFFFSFYLNSLLVLYALLLCVMLFKDVLKQLTLPHFPRRFELVTNFRATGITLKNLGKTCKPYVIAFIKREYILIAMPVAFLLVKHFTTLKSPTYGSYNRIDYKILFTSFIESFRIIWPTFKGFFAFSKTSSPPVVTILAVLICFLLIKLAPRIAPISSLRKAFIQFSFGILLFAAAIYPYLVVQKPPILSDFYESRQIMPAIAGFDLILLSFISAFDLLFKRQSFLRSHGRDALLACLLGFSISCSFIVGTDFWRDWSRQIAIMDFIKNNLEPLKDVRTFVFEDTSTGRHIGDRYILNYEYTGDLITVYGERERLGVGLDEYSHWDKNVILLQNAFFRERYNIRDYQFNKPHAIIYIKNGLIPLSLKETLNTVYLYLSNGDYERNVEKYFDIHMAYEFTDTEQRVPELYEMAEALAAYKLEHGYYPVASQQVPDVPPVHAIGKDNKTAPPAMVGDIPGLFPKYMDRPASMATPAVGDPSYVYISDGVDYKLVYNDVRDFNYAKQAHPALIDPERRAYGVWTAGAKNW